MTEYTVYDGQGTTVDGGTWTIWTSATGSTTNNGSVTCWNNWIISGNATGVTYPVEHEAEARATVQRIEQTIPVNWREQQDERARKQQDAELRANELLLSLLDQRQRKEYKDKNQISIYQGRKPKYILYKRAAYNIAELDDCGVPTIEHCVQTLGTPLADQLATQYLYLHTNPAELLGVANHRPAQEHPIMA